MSTKKPGGSAERKHFLHKLVYPEQMTSLPVLSEHLEPRTPDQVKNVRINNGSNHSFPTHWVVFLRMDDEVSGGCGCVWSYKTNLKLYTTHTHTRPAAAVFPHTLPEAEPTPLHHRGRTISRSRLTAAGQVETRVHDHLTPSRR